MLTAAPASEPQEGQEGVGDADEAEDVGLEEVPDHAGDPVGGRRDRGVVGPAVTTTHR